MNFEFAEESSMLRESARSFLRDRCPSSIVRGVLEGKAPYAEELWREMAAMGWLGATIPEDCGGAGLGHEVLCVLAEELGRVLAPVPFGSCIYLATEAILAAGSEEQRRRLLPAIAAGEAIGTFALTEALGRADPSNIATEAIGQRLSGRKWPVPDGQIAGFAIVAAKDLAGIGLYLVALDQPGISRRALTTFDPSRGQAELTFADVACERLGAPGDHWPLINRVIERAAVLTAFEQVGGAEACLYAARDYAMDRIVFGRPLASFQAIKHKLADIFVEIEIARSNAYFGAWALSADAAELPRAAAAARVAAIEAYRLAAKENIQVHGGSGFTWEFDCHLFYRRAKALALSLGGAPYWAERLVDCIQTEEGSDGL